MINFKVFAFCLLALVGSRSVEAHEPQQQPQVLKPEKSFDPCNLPALPPKPTSQRLELARRMLSSGNPDLVLEATKHLDLGLTEQHQIDMWYAQKEYDRAQLLWQRGCASGPK